MKAGGVALVHPLGDFGISTYCHQAAEALGSLGVPVELFTVPSPVWLGLPAPQNYTLSTLLGTALFKQPRHGLPPAAPSAGGPGAGAAPRKEPDAWKRHARELVLAVELAAEIRRRGHRFVWTQWFEVANYGPWFRPICRAAGLRLIHSVHNVLPHEEHPGQARRHGEAYRQSSRLIVHSESARRELERHFPEVAHKAVVARMGVDTLLPRLPDARRQVREELRIAADQTVALFPGAVRPYKNIDGLLQAMALPECRDLVLVVAGRESGYDGWPPGGLSRTREMAQRSGVADRVRFVPGSFSQSEMAGFYEMADVVALPYLEGFGSGVLVSAMRFGVFIAATAAGGAEEYLAAYPSARILRSPDPAEIAAALAEARRRSLAGELSRTPGLRPGWEEFARTVITLLE